ncbi:MAG: hypothetical protein COV43_02720 [Deltaproteobacteria bacterium CG11_big_fil_rev_8_21_14_0_20_42_23]|nr:MAG: hypothetical protein COV43_02720 [Deltaproteobacteria bacterium CG11_big_fil_rev_8_21_14_0_20_42_23]PJC63824.1 MAG: hypothetical protein CO021_07430 [Deltaproteobacteria bacterium CG_4_9_14_0_2_um_filter_42_21]
MGIVAKKLSTFSILPPDNERNFNVKDFCTPIPENITHKRIETVKQNEVQYNCAVGANPDALELTDELQFMLNSDNWKDYLPSFDALCLKVPFDPRNLPQPILDRIQEVKAKVEAEIQIPENAAGFCDAFVPKFYEAGLAPFADEYNADGIFLKAGGGLGFGYPYAYTLNISEELTAEESFEGVLNPSLPLGSCTEASHRIDAAFLATGIHCNIKHYKTQTHMYARYNELDLDCILK